VSAAIQPNVPVTQTSPYALAIGDRGARVDDSTPQQEDQAANRAGDRRSTAPPSPPPPDIALAYRINDAVKLSGLSRSSIYKLIGEGKLRSVLVAGRRLIPADALRSLLGAALIHDL
jgi:hypothetical protein